MTYEFSGRRSEYYERMKHLARDVRAEYALEGPRVSRTDMRRIYKNEGIRIDLWPYPLKNLRGAYFNDEHGASVLLDKSLPDDPFIFTLGHELKHHLADRELSLLKCVIGESSEPLEIGAEVFAAELLLPDDVFRQLMSEMSINSGECTQEALVRLKHDTRTTLSYAGLRKKAIRLGYADDQMPGSNWRQLERQIFGIPFYMIRRTREASR